MLFAGMLTFAACLAICTLFDMLIVPRYVYELGKIIIIIPSCLILYFVINVIFKMEYAKELLNKLPIHKN
jgi:hypothetical protein